MKLHINFRRYTTWLLLFSFLYAVQLSAAPLPEPGMNTEARMQPAEDDPSPGAFEQVETPEERYGIKKTPWVLIFGISAAAIIGVFLVFVVFKKAYDITGQWTIQTKVDGDDGGSWQYSVVFTGDKNSGNTTWTYQGVEDSGTYKVTEKNVEIKLFSEGIIIFFSGKFKGTDKIEGTWESIIGSTGTWTATRGSQSSSTRHKNPDGSPYRIR